ncbi:MAG: hypothetical protein KAH44_04280, partial [Oricola sp.]|nr:hypothetical protein [Oricola sp.]
VAELVGNVEYDEGWYGNKVPSIEQVIDQGFRKDLASRLNECHRQMRGISFVVAHLSTQVNTRHSAKGRDHAFYATVVPAPSRRRPLSDYEPNGTLSNNRKIGSRYTFTPAQLGIRCPVAQAFRHDADLLFRRILFVGGAADVFDNLLTRFR